MTERLWYKIGEAAESAGVSPRDIRYWEKVIPEIRPRRSQGNLRYYHKDDLPKLYSIAAWIKQGFSVADCRKILLTGSLSRGLDLDIGEQEEPGNEIVQTKTPEHVKPKPKIKPKTVKPSRDAVEPTIEPAIKPMVEPTIDGLKSLPAQQLQDIIDALKELLSRLQKPIA